MKTINCDYCNKDIFYHKISLYAETTYLLKGNFPKRFGHWLKGVKPVARHKDVGFGKYAIICFECEENQISKIEDQKENQHETKEKLTLDE